MMKQLRAKQKSHNIDEQFILGQVIYYSAAVVMEMLRFRTQNNKVLYLQFLPIVTPVFLQQIKWRKTG